MNQNNEWRRWEAKEHSVCPLDDLTSHVEVKQEDGEIINAGSSRLIWNTNVSAGSAIVAWRYFICEETPVPAKSARDYNVGDSDYAQHKTQPWQIWLEYNLNPWDADLIKRILRTKKGNSRILEYQKMIHICEERIEQLTPTPNFRRKLNGDEYEAGKNRI